MYITEKKVECIGAGLREYKQKVERKRERKKDFGHAGLVFFRRRSNEFLAVVLLFFFLSFCFRGSGECGAEWWLGFFFYTFAKRLARRCIATLERIRRERVRCLTGKSDNEASLLREVSVT